MLYNKPTAGSLGYTSIPMNIGSMTNPVRIRCAGIC